MNTNRYQPTRLAQAFSAVQRWEVTEIDGFVLYPWQSEALLEACSDVQDGPRARVDVDGGPMRLVWLATQEALGKPGRIRRRWQSAAFFEALARRK